MFTKVKFITGGEHGGSQFALYSLYRFYVEIEHNKITGKRSFISGELHDKLLGVKNFKGLL